MSVVRTLFVILSTCAFLMSCSEEEQIVKNPPQEDQPVDPPKEEEEDKPKVYRRAVLDISDATSLIGMENLSNGRVATEKPNLFKVTKDGKFEIVSYVYDDGTPLDSTTLATLPTLRVHNINQVNDDYLVLNGSFTIPDSLGVGQHYHTILVRKSDGAIYDFVQNFSDVSYSGEPVFKHDQAGNVYYKSGFDNNIVKMSLSNPDLITRGLYLPSGQIPIDFEILPDGACLYSMGVAPRHFRVRKATGGIFEISIPGQSNGDFWSGLDGQVYFATISTKTKAKIHRLNTNGNNVTIDTVCTVNDYETTTAIVNMQDAHFKIQKEESTLFISLRHGHESFEFFEKEKTARAINLPFVRSGCFITASKAYYYIAYGPDIYKIDINTHQYSNLLNPGEYEVYSMNADQNDNLQFSALRFSDGKKILAEIKDGVINVIDEEQDRKATILQRLY